MAGFGEPWQWTKNRLSEAASYFPTLSSTSPDDNLDIDAFRSNIGELPSMFSRSAMGIANYAASLFKGEQQNRPSIYDREPEFGSSAEEMAAGRAVQTGASAPAPERAPYQGFGTLPEIAMRGARSFIEPFEVSQENIDWIKEAAQRGFEQQAPFIQAVTGEKPSTSPLDFFLKSQGAFGGVVSGVESPPASAMETLGRAEWANYLTSKDKYLKPAAETLSSPFTLIGAMVSGGVSPIIKGLPLIPRLGLGVADIGIEGGIAARALQQAAMATGAEVGGEYAKEQGYGLLGQIGGQLLGGAVAGGVSSLPVSRIASTWKEAATDAMTMRNMAQEEVLSEAAQVGRRAGEGRVPFFGGTREGEVPVPLQRPAMAGASDEGFARVQRIVDETGAYADYNGIPVKPSAGSKGEELRTAATPNYIGTPEDAAEAAIADSKILDSEPAQVLTKVFGFNIPKRGLNSIERAENSIRKMLGWSQLNEEIATPATNQWRTWRSNVTNVANSERDYVYSELSKNFKFNDNFEITDLAGKVPGYENGVTFADLLADRQKFDPFLTNAQRTAVNNVIQRSDKFNVAAYAIDPDLAVRSDIQPGGQYWHRMYQQTGPAQARGASRVYWNKKAYEKFSDIASDAEVIKSGRKPAAPWDAYASYVKDVGDNAANKYLDMYFQSVGVKGKTKAEFVPTSVRQKWEHVTSRLSSARRTANEQEIRMSQQEQEAARASTAASRAIGELAESSVRRGAIRSTYDTEDLNIARNAAQDAVNQLRSAAREVAISESRINEAQVPLTNAEKRLIKKAKEIDNAIAEAEGYLKGAEISEAESAFAPFENVANLAEEQMTPQWMRLRQRASNRIRSEYNKAMQVVDKLERQYDSISNDVEKMASRVDDLIEKNAIDKDLDEVARQNRIETRKFERSKQAIDRRMAQADREIQLLERFANRAGAAEESAAGRLGKTASAYQQTLQRIEELKADKDEMKVEWDRAQRAAAGQHEGMGQINDLAEFRGRSFPVAFSNAVKAITEKELDRSNPKLATQVVQTYNAIVRLLGLGIDAGQFGIQGLLGLFSDTRAFGTAVKNSVRAFGDPKVLGTYYKNFDETRAIAGRPQIYQWANSGMHVTSNLGGEFTGENFPRLVTALIENDIPLLNKLGYKVNPIRAFGRSFETFGNVLRAELNDTAYEISQNKGRNAVNDMRSIARNGNRMTGWTDARILDDSQIASLANFAPRYFGSLFDTVLGAAKGSLPGAEMGDVMARRALTRLIGYGTMITFMVNAAQGHETDTRLIVDGRVNRKFIRMRVGNDYRSIFGGYERLLHLFVMGITGEYGDIAKSVINSPSAERAWTLITGQSAGGERVQYTPAGIAETLTAPMIPSLANDYANSLSATMEGKIGGAIASSILATVGSRGGGISPSQRARLGEFNELSGQPQLEAIPAETWRMIKSTPAIPAPLRDGVSPYDSYSAWRKDAISEYEKMLEANTKLTPSNRAALAKDFVDKHPISKINARANTALETIWVAKNPQLAEELLQQEMNLKPELRRFSVNRPERAIIQAAFSEQ